MSAPQAEPAPPPGSERWAWIELLGFDSAADDLGVDTWLARTGFVPDGVSLRLYDPDFVHTHGTRAADSPFPVDVCSDDGGPVNKERSLRPWTPRLLQRLVQSLQARGTRVFVCVFDLCRTGEWTGQHVELLYRRRNGETVRALCPWKRLADGTLYEDFFVSQLVRVLHDYGFDGYHCADGYAHQRLPISEGDFSDDVVGQFVAATGSVLPDDLRGSCDADAARLEGRARWLWAERRREWIAFSAARLTSFVRKVADAVHGEQKHLLWHSAWTKDPFEALYRYGVDYRANADAGIDICIVGTAAGAAALDGDENVSGDRALLPAAAALLLSHACAAVTPLLFLNGTKGTTEQRCLLGHTPPLFETEVHTLSHLFGIGRDGRPRRIVAGPMACLPDGMSAAEWTGLRRHWDLAVEFTPNRVLGATLIWSDAAHTAQLDDYLASRRWSVHRLLHRLLEHGAPVHAIVRSELAAIAKGPLLVLNAHLFPADELRHVLGEGQRPVVLIGAARGFPGAPDLAFRDPGDPEGLCCVAYGLRSGPSRLTPDAPAGPAPAAELETAEEPSGEHDLFCHDLPYRHVSAGFLRACADILSRTADGVRVLSEQGAIRVTAMEDERGVRRLLIGNDAQGDIAPQLDVGRPIRGLTVRTPSPAVPGPVSGSTLSVRVPGRGLVIVDAE